MNARPIAPVHSSFLEIDGLEVLVYCPACQGVASDLDTGKPICGLDETLCGECLNTHVGGCSTCFHN